MRNAYNTEKTAFAAYLIASDKATLIKALRSPHNNQVYFYLTKEPSPDDVTSYFNGTAKVSALRFAQELQNLKSVMYEANRARRENG